MADKDRFKQRYKSGDTPWHIGKPDFNLIQTVTATPVTPCKGLEIGCGTGDNSIWLSQQGFRVVGIDASEVAIEKAKSKAVEANVKCTFIVSDILTSRIEGAPPPRRTGSRVRFSGAGGLVLVADFGRNACKRACWPQTRERWND
jgi:SAM-dependent methyltransferase